MESRWKHPHSGHNAGITHRGEGSENASLGGKWCLFSDPSPLRAQLTNPPPWKCFFDDVFNSLSTSPFKIRMVITQSLYDEGIKKFQSYRWSFVDMIPIPGIMQNYG